MSIKTQQTKLHLFDSSQSVDWEYETQRLIKWVLYVGAKIIDIDLFCGAGGRTYGASEAEYEEVRLLCTILGINHDPLAVACHKITHKNTLHLIEDVREVRMKPIAKMVADIRKAIPGILVFLHMSAECTHNSKAKGGDSRDADSRSLPEELKRYERAIKPDMIQVENVVEFRTWGPLEHKLSSPDSINWEEYIFSAETKFGTLYSKNKGKQKKAWISKEGFHYTYTKKEGYATWNVPIKSREREYFDAWISDMKKRGYRYEDRNINSADLGAIQSRLRYFGQFSKKLEFKWPEQTHAKDPEKVFSKTGIKLAKHNAVRSALDLDDKGDSLFVPGRITSPETYKRVFEGGVRYVVGGKKKYAERMNDYDFILKYNSTRSDGNVKNCTKTIEEPIDTVSCQGRLAKGTFQFMPFIVQYNNNCDGRSIEKPIGALTQKQKYYMAFIQQGHNGDPASKVTSIEKPGRVVTGTGGNQYLTQAESILPFLSIYHGNGHNCASVDDACPSVPAADTHSIMQPEPFIARNYTNGGKTNDVNNPIGAIPTVPKADLVQAQSWILDTQFKNIGKSLEESSNTITADRHYPYIVNPYMFNDTGGSVDNPSKTVIAGQGKCPLHLAQVQFADETVYGIVIYKDDCAELRELKMFMAVNNIRDIRMRMLKESELLPIQGLPKDYFEKVRACGIKVPTTEAKKFIGNAVEGTTAKAMIECYGPYLKQIKSLAA